MKQVTLRLPEELAAALRDAAAEREQSVNSYARSVLAAAVDPDLAGNEAERMRERLRRAGLLEETEPLAVGLPSEAELREARAAAGRGKPLSDYVSEGRGPR
ncbi:MAG: transcriptional regulator [Solirubrobacterales bacterium]